MAMSGTDNVPEAWMVRRFMNLERDLCAEVVQPTAGGLQRPYISRP
jgi:hypothetical protein